MSPSRRRASASAVASGVLIVLLAVVLSSCSSGSPSSATTTTSTSAKASSVCSLVSSQQVKEVTGFTVKEPIASNRKLTTTCTYKAADPAQSVIIGYQAGVTPSSFASGQQEFELKYGSTTALSGLGSQAYEGSGSSDGHTTYTVATLVGSSQIVVISSAPLSDVERMAEGVLANLYEASSRGKSSTTTTDADA
jgi:hypothetical protein